MDLVNPVKEHDVTDYSFYFVGGGKLDFTVDHTVGDSIKLGDRCIVVDIKAKPSLGDPDEVIEPETMTLYVDKIMWQSHRNRKQPQPTAEELFNAKAYMQEMAKMIQ